MIIRSFYLLVGVMLTTILAACNNNGTTSGNNASLLQKGVTMAQSVTKDTTVTWQVDCGNIAFAIPTAAKPATEHMEALTGGELKLVDGCLRVGSHILVWPYGYKAYRCNDTVFIHDDRGKRVFRTGDILRVGGGEAREFSTMKTDQYIIVPQQSCKGMAWIVGEISKAKK